MAETAMARSLQLVSSSIWNSEYSQNRKPNLSSKVLISYSMEMGCRAVDSETDTNTGERTLLQRVIAAIKAIEYVEGEKDTAEGAGIEVINAKTEFVNHYVADIAVTDDNIDDIVNDNSDYLRGISETLARSYMKRLLSDTLLDTLLIPPDAFKSTKDDSSTAK
ncbi:MAG: hypothetical protein J7L90_00585 [Dehalococcoidia bacterium]|nr:hypothetical protein [Dehalococcoidia bacterium]